MEYRLELHDNTVACCRHQNVCECLTSIDAYGTHVTKHHCNCVPMLDYVLFCNPRGKKEETADGTQKQTVKRSCDKYALPQNGESPWKKKAIEIPKIQTGKLGNESLLKHFTQHLKATTSNVFAAPTALQATNTGGSTPEQNILHKRTAQGINQSKRPCKRTAQGIAQSTADVFVVLSGKNVVFRILTAQFFTQCVMGRVQKWATTARPSMF